MVVLKVATGPPMSEITPESSNMIASTSPKMTLQTMQEWLQTEGKVPIEDENNSKTPISRSKPATQVIIEQSPELGTRNWIGDLLHYRDIHPYPRLATDPEDPHWEVTEVAQQRFSCQVSIKESPQPFGGNGIIFGNKKDARKHAAKLAMEWLNANTPTLPISQSATESSVDALAQTPSLLSTLTSTNWVGKLQIYRDTRPQNGGTTYIDEEPSQGCFVVTATIGESDLPFGRDAGTFRSKNLAKRYAAMKAIEFLIDNNLMPADGRDSSQNPGTPVSPHTPRTSTTPAILTDHRGLIGSGSPDSTPYVQQVPILCHRLGLLAPKYVLKKDPASPALVANIYADFTASGNRIEGRVGELGNIFGNKKAKEACAEEVVRFLNGMLVHSASLMDQAEVNQKRKRDLEDQNEVFFDAEDVTPPRE